MNRRVIFSLIAACSVLFTLQSANAQSYPWRSNAARTVQPGSRVQSRIATPRYRRGTAAPVSVSFGGQDNVQEGASSVLTDSQPSVSDVPAPPTAVAPQIQSGSITDQVPPSNAVGQWASQGPAADAPGLSVVSNASEAPNYCDGNCGRIGCNLGCEKKLFGRSCSGLEIGGWVTSGYHNRDNGLFNNHSGNVDLSQAWLYIDQQASRSTAGWDVGYRADVVYGLDAQDTQAVGNAPTGAPSGWDNGWDNGRHGFALPQLYVQFANYEWDVKVGKYFTPFGYEKVGSTGNFFYSHSFTFFNNEPRTHTGILAERTLSEDRSVVLGYSSGWDTGFENNSGGNLILGTRRKMGEFINFSFTASAGDTGIRDTGVFTSGVTEVQLTNSMKYVLQTDVARLRDNQEFGIVQYLFRDVTECLALGARLDWYKSDRFFGGPTSSTYGFTMGANYKATANLTIRPELRFDWGAAAVNNGDAIIGIDAYVTF